MQVTIKFQVAAGRARSAMKALVLAESDQVSQALVKLASANSDNVSEVASEVAEILQEVSVQLGQYARMLGDLDKLSNETIVPTPVEDVDASVSGSPEQNVLPEDVKASLQNLRKQVDEMKNFTNFMEQVPANESETYEEG